MSNKNKPFQQPARGLRAPVIAADDATRANGTLDVQEKSDFSGEGLAPVDGAGEQIVGTQETTLAPVGEGIQVGGGDVAAPILVETNPETSAKLADIHETLRADLDLPVQEVVEEVAKEDAAPVFPDAVEARLNRIRSFIATMAPGRPVTLEECQQAHGTLHNFFAFELSQDMSDDLNRAVMQAAAALVRFHKDDVFSDYRVFQNHHVYMANRIELRDEAAIIIKSFIDLAIYGKRAGKLNWEAFGMVVRGAINEKVQASLRTLFLS